MNRHIRQFFIENSITPTSILATIQDENDYYSLRRRIISMYTQSEHARANRIASQMDSSQINSTTDPLVKAKLLKRQQKDKSIILHYTYEQRFTRYKSKIHHLWNASFPASTGINTRLIVGTRNNPNMTKELVRRSPQQPKLKTQQPKQCNQQRNPKAY